MTERLREDHRAVPKGEDTQWRQRGQCAECGKPVVKVRASGRKGERWQHARV